MNKLIDSLPFEAHIPGYNYAGPGTKLQQRLARGDAPVNPLDSAARDHDIVYSKTTDNKERNKADLELADKAWERVKAKDSSIGERLAAYAVTNAMKLKAKLGMGVRKKNGRTVVKKKKAGAGLRKMQSGPRKKSTGIKTGAGVKRKKKKKTAAKKRVVARIIPLPQTGGKLRSILTRIGVADRSIVPTVNKIQTAIASSKKSTRVGKGLYLRPYRSGHGLYLRPWAPDLN